MNDKVKLKREIGRFGIAAGFVNFIVGAGIYVLPASVAILIGPHSILAYLICGLLMISIMLCFAEIGSRTSSSGGPYAYIQSAFGPYVGFLSNILFWFGYAAVADAAIANAMLDMIAIQFEWFQDPINRAIFFAIFFGTFAWINILGVRHGVGLVKVLTAVKLIPLVLLVLIGIFWIQPSNLGMESWPSTSSLGEASLLLFFAFGGGEGALSASGEIKQPKKNVPWGILFGISGVVLLYVGIHLVAQGVLGSSLASFAEAPLAETASKIAGPFGRNLLLGAAVVSIFATLSGSPIFYPRVIYAGAGKGRIVRHLKKLHPKYASPFVAIMLYAGLQFLLSVSGGFEQLAILSSAALLLIYLGVVGAVIKFRMSERIDAADGFRIPGGLTIPVIACLSILWFLFQLDFKEIIGVLIFFTALSFIYLLSRQSSSTK